MIKVIQLVWIECIHNGEGFYTYTIFFIYIYKQNLFVGTDQISILLFNYGGNEILETAMIKIIQLVWFTCIHNGEGFYTYKYFLSQYISKISLSELIKFQYYYLIMLQTKYQKQPCLKLFNWYGLHVYIMEKDFTHIHYFLCKYVSKISLSERKNSNIII